MYNDEWQQSEQYRVIRDAEWRLSCAGAAGMNTGELAAALGEDDRAMVQRAAEWLVFMRLAESVPGDTSGRVRHWQQAK